MRRVVGINFDHMHMGDLLRQAHDHPGAEIAGICDASGLVFGYLGYLMTVGWFERHLGWIALSIGIALLYGGVLRGVFPGTPGISWEGHLSGFLAGCAMARWSVRT